MIHSPVLHTVIAFANFIVISIGLARPIEAIPVPILVLMQLPANQLPHTAYGAHTTQILVQICGLSNLHLANLDWDES